MQEHDKTSIENDNQPGKYIITPSLYNTVQDFLALYDISKNYPVKKNPIMIIGNRGVGKSLFIHIYRKLYEKDHHGSRERIKRLNIAAIPETLIESELFGYKKGAFTGAGKDTPGLVETADLLILEEIGELPKNVQAKLLTFIEDGHYYPVGDRKERKAENIQIIATTNKRADDFRSDFFDRFFKFPVPALYERRIDVLYYLYAKVPDLVKKLKPYAILSLLAYNWPGNVRELDHLIQEAYWKETENAGRQVDPKVGSLINKYDSNPFFSHYPYSHSSINFFRPIELYASLKKTKINVALLETVLNEYGLGLSRKGIKNKPIIKKSIRKLSNEELSFDKFFDTQSILTDPMHDISSGYFEGLLRFSAFFGQRADADKDLLHILPTMINGPSINHKTIEPGMDPEDRLRHEIRLFTESFNQSDLAMDIFTMTEDELLHYYRQGQIQRGGSKAEAARRAGVKYQTFISRSKNI
jgi:transcriptional regulator with AAA-type ATPase domain